MKKNVLALSITAAMLGLTGGAQAMNAAPLVGAPTGSTLALNEAGVGHSLFVPYFTAQDTNSTLINLVNTDRVNGKAVKIRFRGAANSDDLFDFQVFLSPGDVWTASVSKGADGYAKLTTNDASCTKPAKAILNATPFKSTRLDTANLAGDALMAGTREGYIEIFNMADIPPNATSSGVLTATQIHPNYTVVGAAAGDLGTTSVVGLPATVASLTTDYQNGTVRNVAGSGTWTGAAVNTTNALFTAIKHVNKVAPCAATSSSGGTDVFTALDTADQTNVFTANAAGLLAPTSGLMANWTIINVVGAAAWSGQATALRSVVGANQATGHMVYWPQTGSDATTPNSFTADPLLRSDAQISDAAGSGAGNTVVHTAAAVAITALFVDLPDMSTPYTAAAALPIVGAANAPLNQASQLTAALATRSITNEYLTDPAISASTDLVFSMPTKRYSVAFHYGATLQTALPGGTFDDGRRFSEIRDDGLANSITDGYFTPVNTVINQASASNVNGRQICVTGISGTLPYDREESTVASSTAVVVSPAPITPTTSFCGEASVMSISNGGTASPSAALKSTVTRKDSTLPYTDGWFVMSTPSAFPLLVNGLPVLGASFVKAVGGTSTFGATYGHRYTR